MCLIVHKPEGLVIPKDWIEEASDRNPDGWGIMGASGGRLTITRGLAMKKLPKALARFGKAELFVHLRFATHGRKTVENCHPFVICGNKFAVMHNGIFDIDTDADKSRSDTWHYCKTILEPVLGQYVFDEALREAIETSVGALNKLVILRHDGASMIVNRDQGDDKDGFWLSSAYSVEPSPYAKWKWDGKGWEERDVCKSRGKDVAEDFDLESLAWLPVGELEDLCEDQPGLVAGAIRDYFTWAELEKDYR